MDSTQALAQKLERIEFGCPELSAFSFEDAGLYLKSLLLVGYHGRRVPLAGRSDRFRIALPASLSGIPVELLLDNAYEVTAVVRSSRFMPIAPAHKAVSCRREGELAGQLWIEGC